MRKHRLRRVVVVAFCLLAPQALAGSHPNAATITINDFAPATPYPSTITVVGEGSTLTDVNVDLNGVTHEFPDDIDVLLVGPTGANAIIMSDVCGGPDALGAFDATLDDASLIPMPDAGAGCVSNTYAPTNAGAAAADSWPAPAPAPSGGTALSTFNTTNPNGVWKLFVVDDTELDDGSIAQGWVLNMTSTGPTAVGVRDFGARPVSGGVALRWRTASERTTLGFNVFRSSPGRTIRLNAGLLRAKRSGSTAGAVYRLRDDRVRAGASYTYRLQVVKLDGTRTWHGSSSLVAR